MHNLFQARPIRKMPFSILSDPVVIVVGVEATFEEVFDHPIKRHKISKSIVFINFCIIVPLGKSSCQDCGVDHALNKRPFNHFSQF